jgi:transposase, IS30 family
MKRYTHLQPDQLSAISALSKAGLSCAAIAAQLKRSPSTVWRELRRARSCADAPYCLRIAKKDRAQKQRASAINARRYTLDNPDFAALQTRLNQQHSLAQALGAITRERLDFGPIKALPSRSTLYRVADALGWVNRERYPSMRLRRYHTKASKRARALRAPNAWVAQCPGVAERPLELTARLRPLCMEIDTIVGRKTDSARLVVAVCRHTRYTMIGLLKHCTARAVERWLRYRMREQKLPLVCLIPDQGSEFARLPNIKSLTVYPCQPHRPWQKPSVENTNGLIRHYVPKGQLISHLTPEFVSYIEHQLNDRPRLCLNWETPRALLSRLLPAVVHFV